MALDALHSQIFALRTTLDETSPAQIDQSDRDVVELAITETVAWLNSSSTPMSNEHVWTKLQELEEITAPVILKIYHTQISASDSSRDRVPDMDESSDMLSAAPFGRDNDVDYQMALELNRQFRQEEAECAYRRVQKREFGVESQEEEERRSKIHRVNDNSPVSKQLVLGPNLIPTKSQLLSNQTPGIIPGLRRALDASSISEFSALCHPGTSNFSSEFKTLTWGCGYNNAQVLFSYLREASPKTFKNSFGDDVPSIKRIQTLIEEGWGKGIDLDGAEQLRRSLGMPFLYYLTKVGTRKWIGTTEIYTLMTSAGFRCLVHDFDFRSPPYSESLVRYVEDYFKSSPSTPREDSNSSCHVTDRPPLYFQHQGHSRTIVGIEHTKSKKVNLILFDPNRKPSSVMKQYASGTTFKKEMSDEVLKPYRVSIEDLVKKKTEYQILRLQEGMMDTVEIDTRKKVHYIKMN